MPVRPLVIYPDPRLARPADPVEAFDAALESLITDLIDTMRAAPGIGITAPHIGVPLRVVVLELQPGEPPRVFVNPEIERASGPMTAATEGSISMPGIHETVERPAEVMVRFQTIDGTPARVTATGLLSTCLQHEIDQLDGLFWIERLSRLKRERAVKRYRKGR